MKVVVAMSGGVDSSVAAAMLVKDSHEVIGAFMKNWTDTKDVSGVCDWKNDLRDARRVAAKLKIPLMVMDFQKEYKKEVVDYMFREYKAGRTPNPDVLCNTKVKFGPFLREAKKLGADKIATGHYATILPSPLRAKSPVGATPLYGGEGKGEGAYKLMQAKDANKDQTYFLHQLNQEQLAMTLFPIGKYTKEEVRKMAREFNLPTAERKESMGVCFIGNIDVKEFLKQKIKPKHGKIVTTNGKKIGEHEGLAYYTIGQRHGFGARGGGPALYVIAKDAKKNELIVGSEDDPALYTKEIKVGDLHWIAGETSTFTKGGLGGVLVRFRHRQELQRCRITKHEARITVLCDESQRAIAPGQFAVLYKDGECLGGGTIMSF